MKYGLGIDTGGTYTDAVIYDFENERVLHIAKSITIKEDLKIGINNTLNQLPNEMFDKLSLVSLSTTLATNACVEGKGSRAKLILIGCDKKIVEKYGIEYGLPDSSEIIFLNGGHNAEGQIIYEPDWDSLEQKINEYRNQTDAFAVVELWGMNNSDFERKTKQIIQQIANVHVVCGYELSSELNSLKRAANAILNAQLIPIINSFLNAIKNSLKSKGIDAHLVIVRGDGSLMSEEFARDKPIETLLSGPAASVVGGINLTGEKDCIIVDMGGTTSDIAVVRKGVPELASEGATVGKWRTGIKSILINTVGLGGDSLIRHTNENGLTIGPVRVAPLSWITSRYPNILEKIKLIYECKKKHTISLCEFFYMIHDIPVDQYYTENESQIVAALKNGPLSISELAQIVGVTIYEIKTMHLEQIGIIMRCGLTPTDIMHLTGVFTGWDKDAAYFGAMIIALQLNISLDELISMVNENVKEKLYINIVKTLMENEDESLLKNGISKQLNELMSYSYRKERTISMKENYSDTLMTHFFTTRACLVGIGAPIGIFLPDVAKTLNTNCVIPENYGVANAIGAITGNILVEEFVTIKPHYEAVIGITRYLCFSPSEKKEFSEYDDSVEWAKEKVRLMVTNTAEARGSNEFDISITVENNEVEISADYIEKGNKLLLETVVTARAIGKLKWI